MPARRSRASSRDWTQTALWKALEKRASARGNHDSSEFLPTLTAWMRHLEEVLRHGGTAPLDFTLHDADHSFRVAERIHQLLTRTTRGNLSDYELALLLLASYGHDIGMTPQRDKVLAHHRHLFGHATTLTAEETKAYQEFLDEYPAAQPILLPLTASSEDLNLADELTTFYVRERHNDWSAEWLRENLKGGSFGQLPGIVDHLVRLCSSHHWPFSRLKRDDFNPFTVGHGNTASIVHPRFLACLLRLADILENDPERTPEVLFRHRSIKDRAKSLIHWQKDHALSITPVGENRLKFQARPRSARVHKALLDLADAIDHELHGIASIGELMPAEYRIGKNTIRREWHLAPALVRDIHPADDSYEYIDGAFRPDTARLLQLLSGEQLYGNPLVAVRELLQNSFDAVREKIARLRLDSHLENPADRAHEETLGNQEKVTLTLRPGEQGQWLLICEDSGVGLNRSLINKHLLVSGNNRRHDLLDLERRCQAAGFRLARTGQFGIGVLSYFMLADEVEITTTRSQLCGDHDAPGWTFSTRGVGSFGELRQLKTAPFPAAGTRLTWTLRKDHTQNPAQFASDLLDFLKQTLVRIPCRFEFKTEGLLGDQIRWKRQTGWAMTEEDWCELARTKWFPEADEVYNATSFGWESWDKTADEVVEFRILKAHYAEARPVILSDLRFAFTEMVLPDEAGVVRHALPYLEKAGGRSLNLMYPGDRFYRPLRSIGIAGWMGMRLDSERYISGMLGSLSMYLGESGGPLSTLADIEAAQDVELAVNRHSISIPLGRLREWRSLLIPSLTIWVNSVLSAGAGDQYHEENKRIIQDSIKPHL